MKAILDFIVDILKVPSVLVGVIALIVGIDCLCEEIA